MTRAINLRVPQPKLRPLPARAQGGDIVDPKGAKGNETGTTVRGGHRRDRHLHGRPDGRERDVCGGGQRLIDIHRPLNTVTTLASTVPANGDVNPYGVAVVPRTIGDLDKGNVLVSNFNDRRTPRHGHDDRRNHPDRSVSQFAQIDANLRGACPGGIGLTTALIVLRSGWVIVGSLPPGGRAATAYRRLGPDRAEQSWQGRETFTGDGINGPWDMTAFDGGTAESVRDQCAEWDGGGGRQHGERGTVVRINHRLGTTAEDAVTRDWLRFPGERTDAALVIGPTGVGLGANGTLYVADTLNNRIAAIPNAVLRLSDDGAGKTVSAGGALNGELGLAVAPGGDILTVNGGDGNLVEVTPGGAQVVTKNIDPGGAGAGDLFGLAVKPGADAVLLRQRRHQYAQPSPLAHGRIHQKGAVERKRHNPVPAGRLGNDRRPESGLPEPSRSRLRAHRVETFSTGRERYRNETNKTVRGRAGRGRHDGGLAGRTGLGAGVAGAAGFPAFVGPLHHVPRWPRRCRPTATSTPTAWPSSRAAPATCARATS